MYVLGIGLGSRGSSKTSVWPPRPGMQANDLSYSQFELQSKLLKGGYMGDYTGDYYMCY